MIVLHTQSQETLHKVTDHGDMIDRVTQLQSDAQLQSDVIDPVTLKLGDMIHHVTQLQSDRTDHVTQLLGDVIDPVTLKLILSL